MGSGVIQGTGETGPSPSPTAAWDSGAVVRGLNSVQDTAIGAWGTAKALLPAVGTTFSNGQAADSLQGWGVGMVNGTADLAIAGLNTLRRTEASVLNTFGGNFQWNDIQLPDTDWSSPVYGHVQDMQNGQLAGQITVRFEAAAAAGWGGGQLVMSLPGAAGSLYEAGASTFGPWFGIGRLSGACSEHGGGI